MDGLLAVPDRTSTETAMDFDTVVIGAGVSGLYQLYRLRELVLCHFEIIGYSLCSLTRASSVVNCQWALACRSFRSRFHAWTFLISVAFAAIRPPRHCRLRWLSSISAMFNQLPCLGVEWISHLSAILFASGGSNAS